MDIKGGTAFAVILEDARDAKFQTDELGEWDMAFKEYTTNNFGLRWAN